MKELGLLHFLINLVAQELEEMNNDGPEYGKLISRVSLIKPELEITSLNRYITVSHLNKS